MGAIKRWFRPARQVDTEADDAAREFARRMTAAVETARALETSMTPQEQQLACAIMRANGWPSVSFPPAWVWIEVFRLVIARR